MPCGSSARSRSRSSRLGVARVADEAVGLGERGGADELGVDLQREAGRHAGAAVDAGHRLGDVDHRLGGHDVLALGRLAGSGSSHGTTRWTFFQWTASMSTIRSLITGMLPIGSTTMAPVPRFSARLGGLADLGVAGERGLAVDAHAAGAADGGLARAADADRAVLVVAGLEDAVEHRALGRELDRRSSPSRPAGRTRGRSGGSSACSRASPLSTSVPRAATG